LPWPPRPASACARDGDGSPLCNRQALPRLLPLLARLAACADVRPELRQLFGFERRARDEAAPNGHGCPAVEARLEGQLGREWDTKGLPGPAGCTCASLYEHRLLQPFPKRNERKRARH
jgi:hypothetical protein